MRGKRSKQYRKLMQQYGLIFGFREPYQVLGNWELFLSKCQNTKICLVDSQMIHDTERFKMDLAAGLEKTLQGHIKPSKLRAAAMIESEA